MEKSLLCVDRVDRLTSNWPVVALLLWESFSEQIAVHGREKQSDQKATQQGQVPASLLLKKGIPGGLPGGRAPLLPRINIRGKRGKGVWSLVNKPACRSRCKASPRKELSEVL